MSAALNYSRMPGPGDLYSPDDPVEIDTTETEDFLADSVPFVSEAWGELDWDALAKAWQGRDAMEALRLMDNAYEAYKRFHIGRALEDDDPTEALRRLETAYAMETV